MRAGTLSAAAFDIATDSRPLAWPIAGPESGPHLRLQAATIAELYMAAGFLLDDVMDNEIPKDSSVGHETGLGTVVLLIADVLLDEAASALPPGERFRLKAAAHQALLASCDGQMRELRIAGDPAAIARLDVDDAMALTEMKAGSLGELTAIIGAGLAAGVDSAIATSLRACYYHYVTYVQLVDDLTDAAPSPGHASDIALARPTVPSVFFYKTATELGASPKGAPVGAERTIDARYAPASPDEGELRESGTTLFAQLAAEMQRNRAISIAQKIDEEYGTAAALLALLGVEQGAGVMQGAGAKQREGNSPQSSTEPEPTGAVPS
jgi:geranylgeranyl pyrophosphate synthase